jgi:hypothetical protein
MSHPHLLDCQWCGGPHNGGNCPSCGIVESGNGSVYNQNPYSYHDMTDLFHQLPHHETPTYSCEYFGGPHQGFECQTGNTFVYEHFPGNTQNFENEQIPYYSPNLTQQFYCCEYCGDPHFSCDCQTRNPFPCNNYDSSNFDQPSQYTTPQPLPQSELIRAELIAKTIFAQNQFNMNVQNEINCLKDLILRKQNPPVNSFYLEDESDEDEPVEEENSKEPSDILIMGDKEVKVKPLKEIDDLVPTPKVSEEPFNSTSVETESVETQGEKNMTESLADKQMEIEKSLCASPSQLPQLTPEDSIDSPIMGDEHLDTILEKESDEFIKSSVENLIPIPSESEGIHDHVCDVSPPLDFPKDLVETFSDCYSDYSDADSLYSKDIEFIDASLPHSEIVNLEEDVDHFVSTTFNTTITNPLFEFDFEFTLNSVNPIFNGDESETETIMDEVHVYSPQSTTHVPPPYILHELEPKNSNC